MATSIQQTYIPGDQWVFFKVYAGYKTAETILTQVLPGVTAQLEAKNIIQKWFFLRFADPHSHLRVRFYTERKEDVGAVLYHMNVALAPYVEDNLVWKVQIDTYQREIERYGATSMDLAESIFYFDSEATMRILLASYGLEADHYRWLTALRLIDTLLSDFGFDLEKKIQMAAEMSKNFKLEMGFITKGHKVQLDKKYRINKKFVEEVMTNYENITWASTLAETINHKSAKIQPIATLLLKMEENQTLEVPIVRLLQSIIHMTVNRLFRSKQRMHEFVLYDTLERYYISVRAREKASSNI